MTAEIEKISEQIENLHDNDAHDEIIELILNLPEEERGYEMICLLARAYNNIDEYEKALLLLLSVKDEGKYDILWHFRIGFAYYYLDYLEPAEKAFERVLESDPGDNNAQEFLKWIREELKEAAEIKPEQEKAALAQMIDWLSHENKLGKESAEVEPAEIEPAEIKPAGEFDLHGYHYYIFKYKKTAEEPWLLGVCGGYRRRDLEHCGHVFSESEEYDPETAEEKAISIVDMLLEARMNEALKQQEEAGLSTSGSAENLPQTGPFAGFVLLNSFDFDVEEIKSHLKNDWDILIREDSEENPDVSDDKSLVFESGGMTVAVSFLEGPVPKGEAEHYAETNYLWPNAAEVTKTHVAQVLLAVLDRGQPAVDAGILFTKVAASCLKLTNAVGIYTSGTVLQPEFYIDVADLINEGDLPILNWIYFGVYTSDKGTGGYTYGLRMFGKEEIEIVGSAEMPESVHDFLIDISYYVLSNDITLQDGETIGFTDFQKLKISKTKGIALEGYTLKIDY
ncbi:hypothetical protein MmiAt1_00940 [Methanimicrococcus sp. At1]|uniref:DUF4261 domain-containing protein n=1 Tax=Methanimicrococcus hacksteinii TaxID=3028293 RepID=A0ABU3VMG7_9EURY|nr:DUF4261 domain-containing protein [Methanimicrococcus sp. At1]MDV0444566.1 hypothetical protein [Methanimicrococcus sp. At1]